MKRAYTIAEDNDPSGYKSGKGIEAKRAHGIQTVAWPRYSPDLNPLDYFFWAEVNRRMSDTGVAPRHETVEAYKARLRRTAMAVPEAMVRAAVARIKTRAAAVVEANGADIARD